MPKQPTLSERVSKHDKEIAAIRTLLHAGMKMLVQVQQGMKTFQQEMKELQQGMKELRRAQERTEQTLDRFIRSLERGGGNGHTKGRRIQ